MTGLLQILQDYLCIRRALGFQLTRDAALLPTFVAFVEESGSPFITNALALAWAMKPAKATAKWWATRMGMVRTFARYAQTLDPRTEIPSQDLIPPLGRRLQPHIYSNAEVEALMAATCRIGDSFRAQTYLTLIGLLASTGMRVGEAIALNQTDFNVNEKIITIHSGKFGKSREVPLHPTTCTAVEAYAAQRVRRFRRPDSPAFFLSLVGHRLLYKNVHHTFFNLVGWAELAHCKPRRPRIHDLRHTFAVCTLVDWYRDGIDVERHLPALSTYLGHVSPSSTYWYLSAVPELLGVALQRLEHGLGELP